MTCRRKWLLGGLAALVVLAGVLCVALAPHKVVKCGQLFQKRIRQADVALNLAKAAEVEAPLLRAYNRQEKGLNDPELWIAHGGGVGQYYYTNCLEAVQDSLQRGYKYVELDLLTTTDGYLVGGHDWPRVRQYAGLQDTEDKPLSRQELLDARPHWKYTLLFADDICRLMDENPHMILVTDRVQDFELLRRKIPYPDRMVVEAFDCYNYLNALRAGFCNVAFSAWSVEGLRQARHYKLPGVVLMADVLEYDLSAVALAEQMHQEGCCITVHGASISDRPRFVHAHLGKCISRIYTNTWSPDNVPPAP